MKNFWYPLDNAAKIYPSITSDENTCVFRITAVLKQTVNIKRLFEAVRSAEHRFPYFKVRLRKGFFWYYLESVNFPALVVPESKVPCRRFNKRGPFFRVLVKKNRISVEFYHILTDGSGAFEFFKTIIVRYFELSGTEVDPLFEYLKPDEKPHAEEFEDGHNRYFNEDIPSSSKRPNAFHLPFALKNPAGYDVLSAIMPIDQLKIKAKEYGVTVTVYLIAVYMNTLQEIFEEKGLPRRYRRYKKISIEVPIDLRKKFDTKTMRNFSLFVMPDIDLSLGHYTFEEIIETVHHQILLETDKKLLNKILARNVGGERKLMVRSIPLFLKTFLLRTLYYSLGSKQYTGVLTNLGVRSFPPSISKQLEYLVLVPPPPDKHIKITCGVIGFDDKLVLTFGNTTKSRELEKRFLRFITGQGINVKLTT